MTKENKTTIQITKWLLENLRIRKIHPRQSYNDVIEKMVKGEK